MFVVYRMLVIGAKFTESHVIEIYIIHNHSFSELSEAKGGIQCSFAQKYNYTSMERTALLFPLSH